MNWSAQIGGVEDLAPEMEAAFQEGVQSGLEKLGTKGAEMVQENIRTPYNGRPAAVCFGNLVGSVVSTYVRDPGAMGVVIGVSPSLGANTYAAPVETGARAHMPPVSALLPWVQKKFGVDDEKSALSLAWAVAMSIRRKGTQGHQMFSRALDQLEPLAVPALEHEIAVAFAAHGFGEVGL